MSKKPLKFHHFSVPVDELRKVTVPYADRDKEIAASLGKLQEFYNSASNFEMRKEYTKNILRNPNLYSADTDIEEIAGDNALYFNGLEPEDLAEAVKEWIKLYELGQVPDSSKIKLRTWQECTIDVYNALIKKGGK